MIKIEEAYGKDYTFIDVRSPKEFAEDHIPGAVSIPLFSDDERAIIGTLYKQVSKEKALEEGYKIAVQKLPHMVEQYKKVHGRLCIYCWRGGMRSRSVVALLQSIGFECVQLENGYKDYRRFVREQFSKIKIPQFIVLYGLTGSGKTEILRQFSNSIDLENLAQHRGSVFGDVGLCPRSQKMFESLLLKRLYECQQEKVVLIEGESRRIGRVIIPEMFWRQMQSGKRIRVVCPMEQRIDRLYKEYYSHLDLDVIRQKICSIEKFIGKKRTGELLILLDKGELRTVVATILVEYYDQLYKHQIEKGEYLFDVFNANDLRQHLIEHPGKAI